MSNPLFTKSNAAASASERFSHRHVSILKDKTQVDDIRAFTECGWFCVTAYLGKTRVLYVHCESREQYDNMMDPASSKGGASRDYAAAYARYPDHIDYKKKYGY